MVDIDYKAEYEKLKDKEARLEKGEQYEDFIAYKLNLIGINLVSMKSAKYQSLVGETTNGIEIKYDTNINKTNNVYIETHGKWYSGWTERGILKQDNSWLWIIGNEHQAFIVAKTQLKCIYNDLSRYESVGIKPVETERSKGFVIPVDYLRKFFVIKELIFDEI